MYHIYIHMGGWVGGCLHRNPWGRTWVYVWTCACVHASVCIRACVHVCTCACVCLCMCLCVCMYVCNVCMYACMFVCLFDCLTMIGCAASWGRGAEVWRATGEEKGRLTPCGCEGPDGGSDASIMTLGLRHRVGEMAKRIFSLCGVRQSRSLSQSGYGCTVSCAVKLWRNFTRKT